MTPQSRVFLSSFFRLKIENGGGNLVPLHTDLENRSRGVVAFESCFILLIILAAFLGNLVLILAIFRNPGLRTVTNMFLVCLSVADILTASLVMPFTASIFKHSDWIFSDAVCISHGIFAICPLWISLHMVTLMAVNRYFCVIKPGLYRKLFTKRFTIALICAVIFAPLILTISPLFCGLFTYIFRPRKASCFLTFDPDKRIENKVYILSLQFVYTILPMVLITVCYYKVFRMVKEHVMAARNTIRSQQSRSLSSEELRMTKMLLVIVVTFVICWPPVITVDFINAVLGTGSLRRGAYVAYTSFVYLSSWTVANGMHCNTSKCKELVMSKKGNSTVYPMSHNIKQYNNISLLGVTFQGNCKFSMHVKAKLHEANTYLFVSRSLRQGGYTQDEIDHLFNSIVIPKLLYGISVYAASVSKLTVIQRFLKRCYKRRYTSVNFNIYELLEKSDRHLFYNLKHDDHPLKSLLPRYKDYIVNTRRKSIVRPNINTERFKHSFF
ncbi:kiSS-1 receptor-like [Stylophora pistillata]|uniref:kiSS-1 receptor-like n=1 Tax=Stylophora pistillata TaxID=50429 RepID=UPI000C03E11A|nr:kiSS-1 receptor-like [Stylophora pistillata]